MSEPNPLQDHEFYGKYANVPVADRSEYIEVSIGGLMQLNDIYRSVSDADDEIRRLAEHKRMLIADASQFIRDHQA